MRGRTGRPRRAVTRLRGLLVALEGMPARMAALEQRLAALGSGLDAGRADLAAAHERLDAVDAQVRAELADVGGAARLAARAGTLRRRPVRVLFLVHVLGAWDSCHALVEAMASSPDFEPIVASIPRRFRGAAEAYGEEDVHRGLTARGVPHLRFGTGHRGDLLQLVRAIEPDVIFRQSQWDADIPEELGSERLTFARTCLVPYETMNIVENVPDERGANSAVDSEFHRRAWLVFCANDMMRDMARRDGSRQGAQFRIVGHPKADHLRAARPRWPLGPDRPGRPGRVVWSAHHSIARGWTDFGTFHLVREEMLDWARRSDDEFVFMPHPALLPFPDSELSPIGRAEFDAWMRAWRALPNTAVLSEADYAPTLAASDLMLTDGLSMLVEYQLFEKPVVFLERPGHRPFNAIGEQVARGVHSVASVDDAQRLTEKFLGGEPDPLRERQRENVRRLYGCENSAARILGVLRAEIARERGD